MVAGADRNAQLVQQDRHIKGEALQGEGQAAAAAAGMAQHLTRSRAASPCSSRSSRLCSQSCQPSGRFWRNCRARASPTAPETLGVPPPTAWGRGRRWWFGPAPDPPCLAVADGREGTPGEQGADTKGPSPACGRKRRSSRSPERRRPPAHGRSPGPRPQEHTPGGVGEPGQGRNVVDGAQHIGTVEPRPPGLPPGESSALACSRSRSPPGVRGGYRTPPRFFGTVAARGQNWSGAPSG